MNFVSKLRLPKVNLNTNVFYEQIILYNIDAPFNASFMHEHQQSIKIGYKFRGDTKEYYLYPH